MINTVRVEEEGEDLEERENFGARGEWEGGR
jgi:hypothetical protein